MQITLHRTLAQAVKDSYEIMSEKTHITVSVGILQTLADAIGTLGAWTKVVPGVANVVGWAASMLTKSGDFVITISIEQIASTNDVEEWTAELVNAAVTAQAEFESGRVGTQENTDSHADLVQADNPYYIPGEGYQDE